MIRKILTIGLAVAIFISFCGIASAYINVNLPKDPITLRVKHQGTQSYFDSTLKDVLPGYDISNGSYVGWCGHKTKNIKTNYDYNKTYLYSVYNTSLPTHLRHQNWSKVNYILNNKHPSAHWWQIQYAIWYLLDFGDSGLNSYGQSMIENASLYGDIFYPTYFDIIGILADPGENVQRHFIEHHLIDPYGDADGDGIYNIDEDLNGDGNPYNDNTDGDGLSNWLDVDDDGDSVNTSDEDINGDGDPRNDDTDSDGKPNYLDTDDDNDTIPTLKERQDGNTHGHDVDNDGIPNHLDTDSDGDGLLDKDEGTGDIDRDGIPNYLDPNDFEPPSQVMNLTVKNAFNGKLNLSWDPATDNISVDYYIIFRDNVSLTTVSSTKYTDSGLTIGILYTYKVRAVDTSGNKGLFSDNVSNISTDIEPPSKVKNLIITDAFNGKLNLTWDTATDYDGIDHYEIWRDGLLLINVTSTKYLDTGLVIGKQYNYTVRAVDFSGNIGEFSDEACGISTDTEPPSKVKNLIVLDAKDGKLDLTWDPASDNVGVDHYEIWRDGVFLINTTNTNYRNTGLNNNQVYVYEVRAVDAAGNKGNFSDPESGTPTKTKSSSPPSKPRNPDTSSFNHPPVADASAGEPYMGIVNETIIFNGSKSYDLDQSIKKYLWDFGDGNTSTGEVVSHSYSIADEYTVTLTVWDTKDKSDSCLTTALIKEPNSPPTEPNITGPSEGVIDKLYIFSIFSNDTDSDNIKYIVNWGDGNISESEYLPSGLVFTTLHKWIQPGIYVVKASATDGEDNSTAEFEIKIENIDEPINPEDNNWILIIFALLALMFLLLFIILAKEEKDDDEE